MKGYVKDKVYYKYEKETGKLRMGGGSWTINLDTVDIPNIDKIVYITSYARYEIDLITAMNKGFQHKFKGENKLIVPIKLWNITFKNEGGTNG